MSHHNPERPITLTEPAAAAGWADAVHAIEAQFAAAGEAAPFSERLRAALLGEPGASVSARWLAERGSAVVGAGVCAREGAETVAEIAVVPQARRGGVGTRLLAASRAAGATAIWAHGAGAAARGFARAAGLEAVRELLIMLRPAAAGAPSAPEPPAGTELLTLTQARERIGEERITQEWLRVNNAAFSWHPEQGGQSAADLRAGQAAEWFDPGGVFFLWDTAAERLLGFHWTKNRTIAEGDRGGLGDGEVYVLGVDPQAQGRGVGGLLTKVGLQWLWGQGLRNIILYVEGDNAAALRTYAAAGFAVAQTDIQFRWR